MEAPLFIFLAVVVSVLVGMAASKSKYHAERSAYLLKARKERLEEERRRVLDCESLVASFRITYRYLGSLEIPTKEIDQMIEDGASPYEVGERLVQCLKMPGFINLGPTPDRPLGMLLSPHLRNHHIYMVGKSGIGKTNLMRHMILQDLVSGSGFGVLAPEFELLRDQILPHIPENRLQDVIYFDPTDTASPVVMNPLHRDPGDSIDILVDEVFTILQRIVGEGGPRMDEILRNCLYALIERPGSTLEDIERLLDREDPTLRNEIIQTTDRERIRKFFATTYLQFPKDAHLPITNRIGRFVGADVVRSCLCPPKDTDLSPAEVSKRLLNIRRAMDDKKILLFNVSDGLLGSAASQLIGQFIVSKFQTATMSRANVPEDERVPFYLYLDEFQNFCGTASESYEKMLSRSRKYKLGLILAHQQTHQIPPTLLREVFGNVSTLIAFQISHGDAIVLAKNLGTLPSLARSIESGSHISNDSDPAQRLTHLPRGVCFCRSGLETLTVQVPLVSENGSKDIRDRAIEHSRNTYGISRRSLDKHNKKPQLPPSTLSDIDPGNVFE